MKKAIIIGASSGIGKELARTLARDAYRVGITGRRESFLAALKNEAPDSFLPQVLDVSDTETCISQLDALVDRLGGLDLLVICAGTGEINDDLLFEIERETIATNVLGFTCVADWAFRYFRRQALGGHLVTVTSVGGLRGNRRAPAYGATKAFQINYSEALRQLGLRSNPRIFVTDIRPGLVDTAMAKGEGLFWVMPVKKTVAQMYRAIKRKRKVVYVTRRWGFMAALSRHMPRFIVDSL